MLGFWYNDLTRAQDGFKVALVELRDADIYYVYSLADFSYYCGYSLVAAGLGIDRNLVLDYGRTSAWRLNFKNQTYPSNPGVNPDLIRPKTKKFPLDPQFKPTVQCSFHCVCFLELHISTFPTAGQQLECEPQSDFDLPYVSNNFLVEEISGGRDTSSFCPQ